MAAERTLPIPSEHREFTVKVDGEAVGRGQQLLAVSVNKTVNRISSARLAWLDGSASKSDFPLSNAATFVPGSKVEILVGPSGKEVSLFKGLVVRHSIKVRDHTAPQLVVDCRHAAAKLAVGRKNALFHDQTDADIISALIGGAGIKAEVESTSVQHAHLVQFRCSDWDFLLARAEANGKFVYANDDSVTVKSPASGGESVCTLLYGSTLLELDAEIDARLQFGAVKSTTWDPAQQALLELDAADPGLSAPGNLTTTDLAAVAALPSWDLRHASLSEPESQAWADAQWFKSQLSRVSGRAKCEGIATINLGNVVTLAGVGDRFNGDVLVTGIRHVFDLVQGWKTHVQFGSVNDWHTEQSNVGSSPAGALLPAVRGLQIGQVSSNEDSIGEHRVRVRLPLVDGEDDGVWARVANLDAGADRGFFFRPEIDDEVVVGFLEDDPRQPVILGMLHSSAKPAPLEGNDDNHEKVFQSRSKMRLYFDDDKKILKLETPAGNRITLSEDEQSLRIEDQNGNMLEMNADGVRIESAKAIELKASTEIKLESGTSLSAKGGTELKVEGTSSAELSSPATTTVKGGLLQLN